LKYQLRRISALSIARFGCLLGWLVTIIPSLACGLGVWWVEGIVRAWLESWKPIDLGLLGTLDPIDMVHLKALLEALQTVEGHALPLLIAVIIAAGILGGGLIAVTLAALGWGYNLLAWLSGGVVVELQELPSRPTQQRLPQQRPTQQP
jgi:hypothetical protein